MSKISYLHLKFKTSKSFEPRNPKESMTRRTLRMGGWNALRAFLLVWVGFGLSCSHLRTPDYNTRSGNYRAQGEDSDYASSSEYYNSTDLKRRPRPIVRGAFNMVWPVANPILNRGFKPGPKAHLGLDLKGRKDDPIYSAHDGVVIYTGQKFRGYGKMIIVEYDNNWASLYGHLNRINVVMGDEVKAGQLIGKMGRTGRATGVHLHFEVLKDKLPVDPFPLLQNSTSIPRSLSSSE